MTNSHNHDHNHNLKEYSFPNFVIHALLLSKCRELHSHAFVVKSTRVPKLEVFFTFLFRKLMKSN